MKTIAGWLLLIVFCVGTSVLAQTAEDDLSEEVLSILSQASELMEAGDDAAGFQLVHDYLERASLSITEQQAARNFLYSAYEQIGDYQSALNELIELLNYTSSPIEKADLFDEMAFCCRQMGEEKQAATYAKASQFYYNESSLPSTQRSNGPGWRVTFNSWIGRTFSSQYVSQSWFHPTLYATIGLSAWLLMSVINLFLGRRQSREARGSTRRRVFVSIVVAFMELLPLLALCLLLSVTSQDVELGSALWTTLITVPVLILWVGNMLLPPARWLGSKEEMKEVDSSVEGFYEQLQASAKTMQIEPPVVRVLPSFGVLAVQAFVGGLPQPSIAISDGTMLRLEPVERDAIVSHEMGHIANGSLWWYPAVISVCGLITVLVSLKFSTWVAIAYGLAMFAGLFRIVSRYFEYSCDRLAGQAVGFSEMVNALRKVHAALIVKNTGWKSMLAYAMATHPSVEERLSALTYHAPEDRKPEVTWSAKTAHRRHVGSLIAGGVWLVIMGVCLIPPTNSLIALLQYIALTTVFFLPGYLLRSALHDEVKQDAKRRKVSGKSGLSWFWIVLFVSVGAWWGFESTKEGYDNRLFETLPGLIGSFLVMFLLFLFYFLVFGKRDVNSKIILAMHQQRWQDAIDIGEKYSKEIKKQVEPQHSLVMCQWLIGERNKALYDLERLKKVYPNFKQSWITEACLRSELLEHERVLELAREVIPDLKQDTMPHLLAARSLIHLNRLEEAEVEMQAVEKLSPDSPSLPLIRAKIASDRQQPELARDLIKQSHELLPGDPGVLVTEAEIEIRYGSKEKAKQLLKQARILLDAAPFTLYDWRYNQVRDMLNET